MRRVHGAKAVTAMALVVLALAGCGGSDDPALAGPEPWTSPNAVSMQPPGTPLGGALVVPDGAELIGPVFSTLDRTSPIEGGELIAAAQQAYLLSNADIVDVSDDIVDQLGGPSAVEADDNDSICNQWIDRGGNLARTSEPYSGDLDVDAVEVICSGLLPNSLAEEGPGLTFELRQDVTASDQPVMGTVTGAGPDVEVPGSLPDAPDVVGGPATISTGVDGYPDEVFDEYLRYEMPDPPEVEDDTVGDLRVSRGITGGAGGVTYTVTLNEIGGEAWILLEAIND